MRRIVDDHRAAMDEFDPDRKIGLVVDEWGCWHRDGTGPSKGCNLFEQQSSLREAVVAALTLSIFNNRCDVVAMANIAQLCNNLHSLYLAGGEHFVETPNYHVFDLFKTHQGGKHIGVTVHAPAMEHEKYRPMELLSASASEKNGKVTITMANLDMTHPMQVKLTPVGGTLTGKATLRVLSHEDVHTCNTFEDPTAVTPVEFEIDLADGIIELPAGSVAALIAQR